MKGTSSKAPSGILLDAPTQGPRGILEIRWITRNLYDLSKAYFAVTFLSSSPTCPAMQSGLHRLKNGTAPRDRLVRALLPQPVAFVGKPPRCYVPRLFSLRCLSPA